MIVDPEEVLAIARRVAELQGFAQFLELPMLEALRDFYRMIPDRVDVEGKSVDQRTAAVENMIARAIDFKRAGILVNELVGEALQKRSDEHPPCRA